MTRLKKRFKTLVGTGELKLRFAHDLRAFHETKRSFEKFNSVQLSACLGVDDVHHKVILTSQSCHLLSTYRDLLQKWYFLVSY